MSLNQWDEAEMMKESIRLHNAIQGAFDCQKENGKEEKINFVVKRTESTSEKGVFPKSVLILVKHPSGMPEINCMGVNGVATRAIGDYWEVKFRPSDKDTFIFAAFHKNSLEVLGR